MIRLSKTKYGEAAVIVDWVSCMRQIHELCKADLLQDNGEWR